MSDKFVSFCRSQTWHRSSTSLKALVCNAEVVFDFFGSPPQESNAPYSHDECPPTGVFYRHGHGIMAPRHINAVREPPAGGWHAPVEVLSIILRTLIQPPYALRHNHSSSSDTSRYLLDPHSLSATYFKRAVTSMSALLPSGKVPTTRVRLLISRLSRSMALLVRMRRQ